MSRLDWSGLKKNFGYTSWDTAMKQAELFSYNPTLQLNCYLIGEHMDLIDKRIIVEAHKDSSGNWVNWHFHCPCETVDEQIECLYFFPLQKDPGTFLCGNMDGDICRCK